MKLLSNRKQIFTYATFYQEAYFTNATFSGEAYFSGQFNNETNFNYALFESEERVFFDIENLSCVSFMNTDLTGVRFNEKARWGLNNKEKFKTIDERRLEEGVKRERKTKEVNLASIKALYRSLRDNYEYRMRYDESSQFFIREMELKRKYSEKESASGSQVILNGKFTRNLSITGLYCHLFGYGENLKRIAFTTVLLFAIFSAAYFYFVSIKAASDPSHATDRFFPFVNSTTTTLSDMFQIKGSGLQLLDFIIRISSLPLVGIVIIALKRKFERKVRH
jgi:hypothetical protein